MKLEFFGNFFTKFIILQHDHPELSEEDRTKALVYSVALGILSAGLVQGVCVLVRWCVKPTDESDKSAQKTDELGRNVLPRNVLPKAEKTDETTATTSPASKQNESKTTRATIEDPIVKEEKIVAGFPPAMVNALGGEEGVLAIPYLENWDGDLSLEKMTAPIMRGNFTDGSPFLLFCFTQFNPDTGKYEKKGEYLCLKEGNWESANASNNQMSLKMRDLTIRQKSREEHYMLDRIRRIIKGEPVGVLVLYPNIGLASSKPEEKDLFRPKDAYLEGAALEEYMDFETYFYERKCLPGSTDLFLNDPTQNLSKNIKSLEVKYPNWEQTFLESDSIPIVIAKPIKKLLNTLLPENLYSQGMDSLSVYPFVLGGNKPFDLALMAVPVMKAVMKDETPLILIKMSQEMNVNNPAYPTDTTGKEAEFISQFKHCCLILHPSKEKPAEVGKMKLLTEEELRKEKGCVWEGSSQGNGDLKAYFLQGPFTDDAGNLLETQRDSFARLQALLKDGEAEDDHSVSFKRYRRFT